MKPNYTHITIVLDRSGSMTSCAEDIIGGFNSFIKDQKSVAGEATVTLAQFDDVYELVHNGIALKDVPDLKFQPRGQTALLDAIGKTTADTGKWLSDKPEHDRPEKVIFVIMTDGHENASREFSREKVFEMIRHQESNYQWQFVFIGANQDAIDAGAALGIQAARALTYNPLKPMHAFDSLSTATRSARASSVPMKFTEDDRRKNRPH